MLVRLITRLQEKGITIKRKKLKVCLAFYLILEIASEQVIFKLLKSSKYAYELIDILKRYYNVKCEAFICEGFHKDPNGLSSESDTSINTPVESNKNLLSNKRKSESTFMDNFISNNGVDKKKEENVEVITKNTSINDLLSGLSNCLNFELFCLKWERTVLLDPQSIIELNQLSSFVSLIFMLSKTKMEMKKCYTIGSFLTNTLRISNKAIDFVIEFEKDVTKEMYGEFISNSFYETNNKEFLMDYVNTDKNHPYIKIETKKGESCNIFFISSKESKIIKEHEKFIKSNSIILEKEIAIKFLKEWRRCKQLFFLNSQIIEFTVMQIKYQRINEIVLDFFFSLLNSFEAQKYVLDYQKESIAKLKEDERFSKLKEVVEESINNLNDTKFDNLFE